MSSQHQTSKVRKGEDRGAPGTRGGGRKPGVYKGLPWASCLTHTPCHLVHTDPVEQCFPNALLRTTRRACSKPREWSPPSALLHGFSGETGKSTCAAIASGVPKIRLVWKTRQLTVMYRPEVTAVGTGPRPSLHSEPFSWFHAASLGMTGPIRTQTRRA